MKALNWDSSFVYYAAIPILISKLLKTKTVLGGGKTS